MAAQRLVMLSGELDRESANRAVATLALCDATGDEPVFLRLSEVSAGLDTALMLVDALDLMGAPVHAKGMLDGAAVAIVAVADQRTAGSHSNLRLREPHRRTGSPRASCKPTPPTTSASSDGCRNGSPRPAHTRSTKLPRTCARTGCSMPRRPASTGYSTPPHQHPTRARCERRADSAHGRENCCAPLGRIHWRSTYRGRPKVVKLG
jgi:hypothetical protein